MSTGKPPPGSIPTLTEVVPWPNVGPGTQAAPAVPDAPPAVPPTAASSPLDPPASAVAPLAETAAPAVTEAQLVQRVLLDLQKQVDLMLEVRLREALGPALARATDALVRDARKELTAALRDVVARSVAREMARRDEP